MTISDEWPQDLVDFRVDHAGWKAVCFYCPHIETSDQRSTVVIRMFDHVEADHPDFPLKRQRLYQDK